MSGLNIDQLNSAISSLVNLTRQLAEFISQEVEQQRGIEDTERRETKQKIHTIAGELEKLEISISEYQTAR